MGHKKCRRNKDKESERYTCSVCEEGISTNTYLSDKMGGKCNKCFNAGTKEHTKRKISKRKDVGRMHDRRLKDSRLY